ncbi:MAG: NERD domain-containing protein [Ancrocorticia sp.]|uniref:NERD domain-containing protein n=1 Tax=Ancrocorticia sp. TaxID=2593684 RepID=UPI003F8FB334
MIPRTSRSGANTSERRIYNALEGIVDRPDWIVFHSLPVRQHINKMMGEADFVVVVPGKGVVIIEAKAPAHVEYAEGIWTLDHTPQPHKNPFDQLNGASGSIRAYLKREGVIDGSEPFARILWFTSLGRHHFTGRAPSDLSFFEWELAWADDVKKPTRIIEKTLNEHIAWYTDRGNLRLDPAGLTAAKADAIAGALLRDFSIEADLQDALRESKVLEAEALAEQRFALDLVETNHAVYFDGPAGTGKSYLLAQAAVRSVRRNERTLLTCWNVQMAQQLREQAVVNGPLAVDDLGSIMLRIAGLESHPAGADSLWYYEELPALALTKLTQEKEQIANPVQPTSTPRHTRPTPCPPHASHGRMRQLGGYRYVIVDEFQDIAASPLLVNVILALAGPNSKIMLAGDARQQIMRRASERVDPYNVAKEQIPNLVHARIRLNCRQAPLLTDQAEAILGRSFGFVTSRLPYSVPGSADRLVVPAASEVHALAEAVKTLTRLYGNSGIVILSPRGAHSLASRVVGGEFDHGNDWLRGNLTGEGAIKFGSISALKGIESDAVVITDVGPAGQRWAEEQNLDWDDLLYVALSRAKRRAVIIEAEE